MKPTNEMIAAAWQAWHKRHGGKLGPGPAFVEAIEAALAVMQPAEPIAWAFFSQSGYEHFQRTGDRGYISDISVVPEFVERKSKDHDITIPLYAGPELKP